MPNTKNKSQVELLKEKIEKAESIAVVQYDGTSASEQVQLRSDLREADGEFLVAKNTLIDIAAGKGNLSDSLTGMNALVFSYKDPISAVKALFNFNKASEKLTIKQGMMEDKVLSYEELKKLSDLPGFDELIVMMIHRVQGPAYGMVNVLKASQRNLVYALKAIADQKA